MDGRRLFSHTNDLAHRRDTEHDTALHVPVQLETEKVFSQRQKDIHAERDRKLEARKQRQTRREEAA